VATFRALAQRRTRWSSVKGVASNAVKDSFAALEFEALMVTPIIVKPQAEEYRAHEDAVNHNSSGEFEHWTTL
jgi:hypothetical protein